MNVLGTCNLPFGIKIVPFSQAFKVCAFAAQHSIFPKLSFTYCRLLLWAGGQLRAGAASRRYLQVETAQSNFEGWFVILSVVLNATGTGTIPTPQIWNMIFNDIFNRVVDQDPRRSALFFPPKSTFAFGMRIRFKEGKYLRRQNWKMHGKLIIVILFI